MYYRGPRRIREREVNLKYIWEKYAWKLPKPEEGNRYLGTGGTEDLKKDEPKQTHAKTYHN